MLSTHSFRLASSCAIVALSFLPRVVSAQASAGAAKSRGRSAQTVDTPFYADDLTRDALGPIPNLNVKVVADARMTPGPESHMVIMGANTDVLCPPGKFIELAPNLKIAGFTPVTYAVIEDNLRTYAGGLDNLPMLRIDPPTGGRNRKRVQVVLFDALGRPRPIMQCVVRANIANATIAALDYKESNEQCGFAIRDRQLFTSTCLYLGDMYLGSVGENAGKIDVDERRLPPGDYSCQMVGKNSDGILLPGASSEFTVKPRYTITCADAAPTIVIGEHDDEKLNVTITHTPGLSIKKTRVYIAGNLAEEKEGDNFTLGLPMKNVPTGNCFIEVVGVGDDGFTYPVESIPVKIKNEPWEQRLYNTPEYAHIEENNARIDVLWQEVCSNLERAKFEPSIYRDSKTFSLEKITEHYVVGKSAEFQAAAQKAFIQMTQLQLKTARLYRTLKMRTSASSMFKRVVQELGPSTLDGEAAQAERDALRNEPPTAL